jgi:Flp pilus assembly protein TadG
VTGGIRRGDDGIASVVLVLLTGAFLALAGLVWDGGRAITARQHAADLAEQAARAGANDLNIDVARAAGVDSIDTATAISDACRFVRVSEPGAGCVATATPISVTVAVTTHTTTAVLGIVGLQQLTTHGHATATAVRGLVTPLGGTG